MKSLHLLSCFGLALGACSQGALPSLPDDSVEPVPTTLRVLEAPETLVAGAWSALSVEVLDQLGAAMPGQTISVAVEAQGEDLGLVPPLGNACTTGLAGQACDLVLRSEGPMGAYAVLLTSGNVAPVRLEIEVLPAAEEALLELRIPGRPAVRFRNGERDVLAFQAPVELLASGEPVAVELRLSDRHGNPISAMVQAQTLSAQPAPVAPGPRADAGSPADAGAADAALGDAAPADALAAPDVAPAALDASASDAPSQADAGAPSETPPTVSLGASCQGERAASDQAMPDAQGRLMLCVAGGSAIGLAQIRLSVPGVLQVLSAEGEVGDSLGLRTNTLPSGRVRLTAQGSPQLRCAAGEPTNPLILYVVDAAEPPNPVPGQLVETSFVGLLGVAPQTAVSGADGRLTLRGRCPARRGEAPQLTAYLASDPAQELSYSVEVQIGAVATVLVSLDNGGEDPFLEIGSVGALRLRLLDAQGNTVPQGAVSLSLPEVLAEALALARPACGAALGASISGLTCAADADGEVLLEVRAGGALPGVPVPIQARGHNEDGDDPVTQFDLRLVSGAPAQLGISPAGRLAAVVGADAGEVTLRVSDSGGNPRPNVRVELELPAALEVAPQALSLLTNASGLATWRITQVRAAGQHTLRATANVLGLAPGEAPIRLSAELIIDTSAGQAAALQLRNLDGDIVAADELEGAWVLGGAVGEDVPGVYTLARINGRGGLLAGAGGLALRALDQDGAGCGALADLASAQFNEAGRLRLGDGLALTMGTAARSCRYRLSAGGVHHDLLLVQAPGTPVGGQFERNVGSLAEPVWQPAPQRLEPRPGYSQPPGGVTLSQGHHLRLRNPQDAFGNALVVPTGLQPAVVNGWAEPEVPVLRAIAGGAAVELMVAGGGELGADAVVTASSQRGWEQAPVVRFESLQQPPQVGSLGVVGVDRKAFAYSNGGYSFVGRVATNREDISGALLDIMAQGSAVSIDRFASSDLLYRPSGDNCQGCVAEDPNDGIEDYIESESESEHEAQAQWVKLTFTHAQRVLFERVDQQGRCLEGGRCSRALVTWLDDGLRPLDRAQVIGRFPLRRVADGGGFAYHAWVPLALLSGGGTFGAAIETDAGEDEVLVSNALPFDGLLRPWLRARQLKVLAPAPPEGLLEHYRARNQLPAGWQGFARILDVQRVQADTDDDEELLLCGDDAFGGWVAIAHVDEARAAHGANPFGEAGAVQAVRTYLAPGFLGDPNSDEVPVEKRFVTGETGAPTGCAYVPQSPMGAMVLSFGRPGSDLYPGMGDLVATPVQDGAPVPTSQAGLAARQLPLRGGRTSRATELTWGEWQVNGASAQGPVVDSARFAATAAGEGLSLAAAQGARFSDYAPAPNYPFSVDPLDLTGTRYPAHCGTWNCEAARHNDEQPVEIDRSPGRLLGATDWGGVPGLLRFARHTPYVAWYLPHRYDDACEAHAGRMVCPPAVCGDGQLSYGEVCERGAGCTNACRLVGYEGERLPAGLAVPFAPMQLQDDADPAPEAVLTEPLAAWPVGMKMRESLGDLAGGAEIDNWGLSWGHWYGGRANCRRFGGDLPTERQWEGVASGGAGGAQQGARPFPWGSTPATAYTPAAVLYRDRPTTRGGAAWLGVTPEGLADLTARAVTYGEWTLADDRARPLGENPQSGPTGGHHRGTWKGGGTSGRQGFPVRARSHSRIYRYGDVNGSSRCVWLRPRP